METHFNSLITKNGLRRREIILSFDMDCLLVTGPYTGRWVKSSIFWTGSRSVQFKRAHYRWFCTYGSSWSKSEHWSSHVCRVNEVPVYPPCVTPVQLTRPQLSIFNDCWSWATDDSGRTQCERRIDLPHSFQSWNKQLHILTEKSERGLSLQTQGQASDRESRVFGAV